MPERVVVVDGCVALKPLLDLYPAMSINHCKGFFARREIGVVISTLSGSTRPQPEIGRMHAI